MNEQHASAAEYARSILDAGSASAVSKATYLGAGVTVGGSLSMNEMVGLAGLVLTLLTFAVNWYYKHKLTRTELLTLRERSQREAEAHQLMVERAERERAEHQARMGLY